MASNRPTKAQQLALISFDRTFGKQRLARYVPGRNAYEVYDAAGGGMPSGYIRAATFYALIGRGWVEAVGYINGILDWSISAKGDAASRK
jgi:hypothetical protein